MKRTVTILGGDERMAWLAESLGRGIASGWRRCYPLPP